MTYMKKCLAVLLAVLMCVGVCVFQFASVSAAVSYLPTRYVSMTVENDNDINPLVAFDSSGAFPGTAGTYTVTGYYKIEDLSDFEGRDDGSAVVFGNAVQDNEAGVWLPFEGSFDTACAYRGIYLYYMNGTISMADVVIKNELGDVVYDMATDANWT
ncbi:MAG: hypothetical protein IJC85_01865, partial [Oscillospiraceae bacterium]|nr:hypothetical protein [Oscillospiraceae bacterium]